MKKSAALARKKKKWGQPGASTVDLKKKIEATDEFLLFMKGIRFSKLRGGAVSTGPASPKAGRSGMKNLKIKTFCLVLEGLGQQLVFGDSQGSKSKLYFFSKIRQIYTF